MDSPPEAAWTLKPIEAEGLPPRIEIGADGLSIGRAASNQICLEAEAYPHVSGHHARLGLDADGTPQIEDLGSRNGTYVNGKQVKSKRLRDGDVVRLGAQGPQFVVENASVDGGATVVDAVVLPRPKTELSQTTVFRVRRALGLPEDADVGELVRTSERRARRWLGLAVAAGMIVLAVSAYAVRASGRDDVARLELLNAQLQDRVVSNAKSIEKERDAWVSQRERLQAERATLLARIQELAEHEETSSTELARLRTDLSQTNFALARYDPLTLDNARQADVARVQSAVVFVETKLRYRNSKTGKLLRRRPGSAGEEGQITFDEDAPLVEEESSGSGFCISPEGQIITNAHVVHPTGYDREYDLGDGERLIPEVHYAAVFSNSAERHPARLVKFMSEGDDDLALITIEPFPGMVHLADFNTDTMPPAPGAEVYLHGFPLGKMAIQDGDRVVVSSFRGILSRTVSNWLQVDAAVHPGNSGGPLTDGRGRVIGVVCRVQRISAAALAPDMGYAIPIQRVARLLAPEPPVANATSGAGNSTPEAANPPGGNGDTPPPTGK